MQLGADKESLGHQTSADTMLGCPGAHAHSCACMCSQDELSYAQRFTSHLFRIYISSPPSL